MNLLKNVITDAGFIDGLIPQRKPFVMVDKLLFYSKKKVVSGLTIVENNLFTHSDTFVAPGLIEHMAQTVALHTGYQYYIKKQPAPTGYIGSIKKADILALPKVAQELTTTAIILHEIMGVTLVEIQVECNQTVIATSEMKTVLAKE